MNIQQTKDKLKAISEDYLKFGLIEIKNSIDPFNDLCEQIENLERDLDDFMCGHVQMPTDNFNADGLIIDLFETTLLDCEMFKKFTLKLDDLLDVFPDGEDLESCKDLMQDFVSKLDYELNGDWYEYDLYEFYKTAEEIYNHIGRL